MASATPPLLLCNTKAPNYRNKKAFKDLGHYSEWPKVADAVIEANNHLVTKGCHVLVKSLCCNPRFAYFLRL
jgi:hypothetical protein